MDWLARAPELGVGLLLTQFQASPPSAAATAPAGSASSTHTILGELALKLVTAKMRRPSGNNASASIHWLPLFLGEKVKFWPKQASWSRASQVMRAPLKSNPGACKLTVSGAPTGTTPLGALIWPLTDFQGCVLSAVW